MYNAELLLYLDIRLHIWYFCISEYKGSQLLIYWLMLLSYLRVIYLLTWGAKKPKLNRFESKRKYLLYPFCLFFKVYLYLCCPPCGTVWIRSLHVPGHFLEDVCMVFAWLILDKPLLYNGHHHSPSWGRPGMLQSFYVRLHRASS